MCNGAPGFEHEYPSLTVTLRVLQERVSAREPPSFYLAKLRTYLDPTASRSPRVSRLSPDCAPAAVWPAARFVVSLSSIHSAPESSN